MLSDRRPGSNPRFEADAVLPQEALIKTETLQQLAFRKPGATLVSGKCVGRSALCAGTDTVGAGEFMIALDFAAAA